ncbi:hypothetical protein evm_013544 [Chilo suppressalis]|nr:hypothetical protein evm_013544 [Chilo suppressalis]
MLNLSIPIDRIVDLVKNLLDGIRCPICDKSYGDRGRYLCGHIGCDDCVTVAEECALCLAPPHRTTHKSILDDKPLSKRVKNANNLLNACQKTFNVDVFKYKRISEQLNIEKELFPNCIQAPVKYYNKRKTIASTGNKENSLQLFPGEHISPRKQFKMKRQSSSVLNWLDDNNTYSRKVFSELSTNHPTYIHRSKKVPETAIFHRKRVYSSSPVRQHEKSISLNKKIKRSNLENNVAVADKNQKKCVHEDSGIALDDEPIYIEDSQSEIVDKDKLALLAVEQAEKELSVSKSLESSCQTQELRPQFEAGYQVSKLTDQSKNQLKVPFYRKSCLVETCLQCQEKLSFNDTLETNNHKNISISIENCSFITKIEISDDAENMKEKNSIGVQTDINNLFVTTNSPTGLKENKENSFQVVVVKPEKGKQESQDIFTDDCKFNIIDDEIEQDNVTNTLTVEDVMPKNRNIVIDDSESDATSDEPLVFDVFADVHVSCETQDYPMSILSEIKSDHSICRSRNKVRGATPDSNNSSEKENCDPNKSKKLKGSKKSKSTKNNTSKFCFK